MRPRGLEVRTRCPTCWLSGTHALSLQLFQPQIPFAQGRRSLGERQPQALFGRTRLIHPEPGIDQRKQLLMWCQEDSLLLSQSTSKYLPGVKQNPLPLSPSSQSALLGTGQCSEPGVSGALLPAKMEVEAQQRSKVTDTQRVNHLIPLTKTQADSASSNHFHRALPGSFISG